MGDAFKIGVMIGEVCRHLVSDGLKIGVIVGKNGVVLLVDDALN